MAKDIKVYSYDRFHLSLHEEHEHVSGIELLAQRVLLELLTEQKSMFYLEHRGTDFISRARSAVTEYDVFMAFGVAHHALVRNLKSDETMQTSPEECIKFVELVHVTIYPGMMSMDLRVVNKTNNELMMTTPEITMD